MSGKGAARVIAFEGISKRYGAHQALQDVPP